MFFHNDFAICIQAGLWCSGPIAQGSGSNSRSPCSLGTGGHHGPCAQGVGPPFVPSLSELSVQLNGSGGLRGGDILHPVHHIHLISRLHSAAVVIGLSLGNHGVCVPKLDVNV